MCGEFGEVTVIICLVINFLALGTLLLNSRDTLSYGKISRKLQSLVPCLLEIVNIDERSPAIILSEPEKTSGGNDKIQEICIRIFSNISIQEFLFCQILKA